MPSPAMRDRNLEEAAACPSASAERQLDWLLHGVGIAPVEDMGWIRVTGDDRVRWLNGMVTNSIQELKVGEGNYSFALNAQGQIQGDLTTFAMEDALLIETGRAQVPAMLAMFDRFIIMDDVELEDVSDERLGTVVAGPRALELLESAGLRSAERADPVSMSRTVWQGRPSMEIIMSYAPLVSRFEIWTDGETHPALMAELMERAGTMNGGAVGDEALEQLRVLEGTPSYGTDILPKHLAQETAQARALHFSKGCYLGQEIVERIRSRGNVHRTFAGFRLEGPLPAPGTVLTVEGKAVGELSSAASLPLCGGALQVGLGMVRREAIERAAAIVYQAAEGPGIAVPVPLPVQPA